VPTEEVLGDDMARIYPISSRILFRVIFIMLLLFGGALVSSGFVFSAVGRDPFRMLIGESTSRPFLSRVDDNDDGKNSEARPAIEIMESDFSGAGIPRPDLAPEDIPPLLMKALENNDFPNVDDGLKAVWAFSGDTTKFVFQNNRTDFIITAHETAQQFVTSFYGAAMNGKSWDMETELNRVGGENGWIATQVMKTICSDGRLRRWQWELRKHRRPPYLGCWYVESIGSSDRKGQFEPE